VFHCVRNHGDFIVKTFLRTHGTTCTIVLFAVSAVSGAALFFHIGSAAFHGMHEWLSMLLVLPVALHLWRNWNGFRTYLKRRTLIVPAVLGIAASLVFAWPAMTATGTGGNPMRAALSAIEGGTIAEVAPLFDLSPTALAERLISKGYRLGDELDPAAATLGEIARASGKTGGPALVADVAFGDGD
jgi:asparagine N-glycosylation enzyme membrane subunit Stt3